MDTEQLEKILALMVEFNVARIATKELEVELFRESESDLPKREDAERARSDRANRTMRRLKNPMGGIK